MAASALSLYSLFGLPILIAQWIGVLGLRRASRGVPWLLVVSGVCINYLMALWPFISVLISFSMHASGNLWWIYLPAMVSMLGGTLFAVGFAMHGLRSARATERQTELEQLVAAMSEDLQRMQERGTGSRPNG